MTTSQSSDPPSIAPLEITLTQGPGGGFTVTGDVSQDLYGQAGDTLDLDIPRRCHLHVRTHYVPPPPPPPLTQLRIRWRAARRAWRQA